MGSLCGGYGNTSAPCHAPDQQIVSAVRFRMTDDELSWERSPYVATAFASGRARQKAAFARH